MLENQLETLYENENIITELNKLSDFYERPAGEILEIGILTNIGNETLPNYKNYSQIMSGITQARMVKGVSGRIESQIEKLLKNFDLEDLNNDLLERATDLAIMTIDSVYDKNNKKLKKAYTAALEDPDFLYINLKLVVKILAEYLQNHNIELKNKTLEYVTKAIKVEKKALVQAFIEAYLSEDETVLAEAKEKYKATMIKMLNDYVKTLKLKTDDAMEFAMEQTIVKKLGKENLDIIIGYILFEIKERIMLDNNLQRKLELKY